MRDDLLGRAHDFLSADSWKQSSQARDCAARGTHTRSSRKQALGHILARDVYAGAAVGSRVGELARWVTGDGPVVARDKAESGFDRPGHFGLANFPLAAASVPLACVPFYLGGVISEGVGSAARMPGLLAVSSASYVCAALGVGLQATACLVGAAVGLVRAGVAMAWELVTGRLRREATELQRVRDLAAGVGELSETPRKTPADVALEALKVVIEHSALSKGSVPVDAEALTRLAATCGDTRDALRAIPDQVWTDLHGESIPHIVPHAPADYRHVLADRDKRMQQQRAFVPVGVSATAQQRAQAWLHRTAGERARELSRNEASRPDALLLLAAAQDSLPVEQVKLALVAALQDRPLEACFVAALPPEELQKGCKALGKAWHQGFQGMVAFVREAGVHVDTPHPSGGLTATIKACNSGDAKALRCLVDAGADPQQSAPEGLTLLHLAARGGHVACVELLIQNLRDTGRDVAAALGQLDHRSCSILRLSTQQADAATTRVLLSAGAPLDNDVLGRQAPLLKSAVLACNAEQVRALIDGGADVNSASPEGGTQPLGVLLRRLSRPHYFPPRQEQVDVLRALLDGGAVMHDGIPGHFNALDEAAELAPTELGAEVFRVMMRYAPAALMRKTVRNFSHCLVPFRSDAARHGDQELSPIYQANRRILEAG